MRLTRKASITFHMAWYNFRSHLVGPGASLLQRPRSNSPNEDRDLWINSPR
jgi:hypothetical protein